jgi:hypothetical protein
MFWVLEKTNICIQQMQNQPVLFCHAEISQTMVLHAVLLVSLQSSLNECMGAPTWFETVL